MKDFVSKNDFPSFERTLTDLDDFEVTVIGDIEDEIRPDQDLDTLHNLLFYKRGLTT